MVLIEALRKKTKGAEDLKLLTLILSQSCKKLPLSMASEWMIFLRLFFYILCSHLNQGLFFVCNYDPSIITKVMLNSNICLMVRGLHHRCFASIVMFRKKKLLMLVSSS